MQKYKGIEVKSTDYLRKFIPWLKGEAFAILGKIYLRQDLYSKFCNNKIDGNLLATLEHEVEHIRHARKIGLLKYEITYYLNKRLRYWSELEAIKKEMKVLKKHNLKFQFKKRSGYLDSWNYLWVAPYDKVLKDLKQLWKDT